MSKLFDSSAGIGALSYSPIAFAIIGVILLIFFASFLLLWGLTTGVALFVFMAIILVVMQFMGAVNVLKAPWLILVPPAFILLGRAGQYFNILTIAPTGAINQYGTVTPVQLTLTNSSIFVMWIAVAAIIIGLILGYALLKRR